MRVVLDVNVLISGLLSRDGAPAMLLRRWACGEFELVVSKGLLAEFGRAVAYPRVRARLSAEAAAEFEEPLRAAALLQPDPAAPRSRSADPQDDYLVALAENSAALLVTGDKHLLELATDLPVCSPADLLDRLDRRS